MLAGIASIERRRGNWEASLAMHRRALELDPWNPSIVWNLGSSLLYLRRYDEAEEIFARAIDVAPGMRTPHFIRVHLSCCTMAPRSAPAEPWTSYRGRATTDG